MSPRANTAIALACIAAVGCGGGNDGGDFASTVPSEQVLRRQPYMGVSCPTANSFKCDRVGLAVRLSEPAVRVDASISSRELALDDPEWSGAERDGMFAGFLQPAGLIDGPLELTPERLDTGGDRPAVADAEGRGYRWFGRHPVSATVELLIERADGSEDVTRLEVKLSPGWG